MDQPSAPRSKILGDHKRVGKKFIPPFKAEMGVQETSYAKNAQPEMLWLGILNKKLGVRWTADFVVALTQVLGEIKGDATWFMGTTEFGTLSVGEASALRLKLAERGLLEVLRDALEGFVSLYPLCPLQVFFDAPPVMARAKAGLELVKQVVDETSYKRSPEGIFMQGHVVYMGFVSGRLRVAPHVSRADLPEIENYPHTEKSKQVGASICASINMFFGSGMGTPLNRDWANYFWKRGLELEPVDLSGLDG